MSQDPGAEKGRVRRREEKRGEGGKRERGGRGREERERDKRDKVILKMYITQKPANESKREKRPYTEKQKRE